jgi:hypothetical protein
MPQESAMTRLHTGFIVLLLMTSLAHAEGPKILNLGDLKAQAAMQLAKSDLSPLLQGATISSIGGTGSSRSWKHSGDGTLIASSDNRGSNPIAKITSAKGTWRISDGGQYCVIVEWRAHTEQWCRYLFKLGEQYYGVVALDNPGSEAYKIAISN